MATSRPHDMCVYDRRTGEAALVEPRARHSATSVYWQATNLDVIGPLLLRHYPDSA